MAAGMEPHGIFEEFLAVRTQQVNRYIFVDELIVDRFNISWLTCLVIGFGWIHLSFGVDFVFPPAVPLGGTTLASAPHLNQYKKRYRTSAIFSNNGSPIDIIIFLSASCKCIRWRRNLCSRAGE